MKCKHCKEGEAQKQQLYNDSLGILFSSNNYCINCFILHYLELPLVDREVHTKVDKNTLQAYMNPKSPN